jgi:hypothetical protein
MTPTDQDAFATQQIAQHPDARERVVQMQFVDPAHDLQIAVRDWSRLVK